MSYAEILALAQTAEEAGFEASSDPTTTPASRATPGLPTTDAWATLAGHRHARRAGSRSACWCRRSRSGSPGNLAKVVTTVAEMSGGRVEVGLGAGWNELEHDQHGLRFPPTGERFDMLEEQLAIVHGLWTEPDGWSYEGRHWQVSDAQFYPKPLAPAGRRHPNMIVGGSGGPRMARLVATYADEFNSPRPARGRPPRRTSAFEPRARQMGRDPAEVTHSAMTGVLVGEHRRRGRATAARAAAQSFGDAAPMPTTWLEERSRRWIMGTPDRGTRARLEPISRPWASSGSCSRPSCRATWTWSACWARSSWAESGRSVGPVAAIRSPVARPSERLPAPGWLADRRTQRHLAQGQRPRTAAISVAATLSHSVLAIASENASWMPCTMKG